MHRYLLFLFFLAALVFSCSTYKKGEGNYIIARDRTWDPLNLMGKDRNLLAFTDDVILDVASSQGFEVDIETGHSKMLFSALDRGQIDGLITYGSENPVRARSYIYSEPFFLLGPVLVVRADTNYSSLTDMKNKSVGVQTGSSLAFNVQQAPGIIFTPFENILFALRGLADGQLDGVIMEAIPAYEYTSSFYRDALRVVPPPLTDDGLRLVAKNTPKGQKLIKLFNEGLHTLYEDDSYRELIDKWNLKDPARDYYEQVNMPNGQPL